MALAIIQGLLGLGLMPHPAAASAAGKPASPDYQLPIDAKTEIIRFDSFGGMLPLRRHPLLVVTADGTVTVDAAWTGTETRHLLLGGEQLQALLHFIIAEKLFLTIQAADIKKQMNRLQRQDGRFYAVADAPTTSIAIDLPGYCHRVDFYALDRAARRFPEISALRNLKSVQDRFQTLMDTVKKTAR